jgi:uncharacterized protein (DUF433 family)
MIIPAELEPIVESYTDLEDGTLCFKGTRVLVLDLIMTLTIGLELEDFLGEYPEVSRELAQAWIDWDEREAAKYPEDDMRQGSHCWPLKLFPPSYFIEREPVPDDGKKFYTAEEVREHSRQRTAAWLEAHPDAQA